MKVGYTMKEKKYRIVWRDEDTGHITDDTLTCTSMSVDRYCVEFCINTPYLNSYVVMYWNDYDNLAVYDI